MDANWEQNRRSGGNRHDPGIVTGRQKILIVDDRRGNRRSFVGFPRGWRWTLSK
jgi:hypothetical protein